METKEKSRGWIRTALVLAECKKEQGDYYTANHLLALSEMLSEALGLEVEDEKA